MDLSISDIVEVREIISEHYVSNSGSIATGRVNELLDNGWRLLKIYTTCHDEMVASQQQTIHYVLGIDKGRKQANLDWDNGLIPNPPEDK